MVRISVIALIYKSRQLADWVYKSVHEFTPLIEKGEAEFFFIANDPTKMLLDHLRKKKYKYFVNRNYHYSEEELFEAGYGQPEYISRVYRGWNQAILHAQGEIVVLINSDMYFSPDWLENLLKYSDRTKIICSKLVERKHPKYGEVFPGAIHGEFGNGPDNFKEKAFLKFVNKIKKTGLEHAGAYMPCLIYRDIALIAGLYPEGNIAGKSFSDVIAYGDEAFFNRLKDLGINHFTALDSIVYHLKEGEMDIVQDQGGNSDHPGQYQRKNKLKIAPYKQGKFVHQIPSYFVPTRDHLDLLKKITIGGSPAQENEKKRFIRPFVSVMNRLLILICHLAKRILPERTYNRIGDFLCRK